jgi:hypothetical protein
VTKAKYFAVEILTQYLVTEGAFFIIPREKWGNGGSTSPHSLRVQVPVFGQLINYKKDLDIFLATFVISLLTKYKGQP